MLRAQAAGARGLVVGDVLVAVNGVPVEQVPACLEMCFRSASTSSRLPLPFISAFSYCSVFLPFSSCYRCVPASPL